jgi:hypothetical protein
MKLVAESTEIDLEDSTEILSGGSNALTVDIVEVN